MNKPNIVDRKPSALELDPGEYWWCACGLSKTQPYCDGSHAGGPFRPVKFSIEARKTVYICNCKHSQMPPFCDGSHKTC